MNSARRVEDLLRDLAPQVLGALVRRYGHFDESEEAVQESLLAAATQWRRDGLPDDPRAWLITVASRRLVDQLRSDDARRRREDAELVLAPADALTSPAAETQLLEPEEDDTLTVLELCCHPALAPASQVALTLRAVGGLTTAEIAGAYLVPEATMAQRISRAKRTIDCAGRQFGEPAGLEDARRRSVLHVVYLIFNEPASGVCSDQVIRLHHLRTLGTRIQAQPVRAERRCEAEHVVIWPSVGRWRPVDSSPMNRTRRLALLLVTLVPLGLTACGSSGSSGKLSKADLIAKGDKICRQARDKGAKLPKVHSYAGFKQLGPAAAKIIDDTLSKQKGLIPPASVKSDYDAYLDNVAKQRELVRKLGDAAKIGNRQGIIKVKKLLTEDERTVAKGRSLARKVGFKLCGNALGR